MFPPLFAIATAILARTVAEHFQRRRIRKLAGDPPGTSQSRESEQERSARQGEEQAARGRRRAEDSAHTDDRDHGNERQAGDTGTSRRSQTPDTLATHLAVLGLQPGASIEQIKAAHRRLALEFHPDRLPAGASEAVRDLVKAKMQSVNVARDVLIAEAESRRRAERF